MLVSREPDVKTVLKKNPNWWGIKAETSSTATSTRSIYTPIVSDATRVAALISGEVDLVNDPPPQDVPRLAQTPNIKVIEGVENRIVFIGMDQARDELLYSNVKGKNPFKDKRVRQALYQAVDIDAINKNTMRGLSKPTGAILPSPLTSTPEIEKRLPFDKAKAKKLLAEAGYPNGFEVTLDCPNNRYVNDERICQALAAMWAQIGVNDQGQRDAARAVLPEAREDRHEHVHAGLGRRDRPTRIFTLQPVLSTYNGKGDGDFNYGRYTNTKLDELTAKVKIDMNEEERLGDDPRRAARAERGDQPDPAAPAGDPVGVAQQRHRRAPRRQQRHPVLGRRSSRTRAAIVRSRIQPRRTSAISARTSASLRPVRAGTWNE